MENGQPTPPEGSVTSINEPPGQPFIAPAREQKKRKPATKKKKAKAKAKANGKAKTKRIKARKQSRRR